MNQAELVKKMAEKMETTQVEAKRTLEAVLDTFEDALIGGDSIKLQGFGNFEVRDVAERNGVNPATGEKMVIPASKKVAFKASKVLKALVNEEV